MARVWPAAEGVPGDGKLVLVVVLALAIAAVSPARADVRHKVRRGDTLWSIAQTYGVTVDQILAANRMTDPSDLAIGTRLLLPGVDLRPAIDRTEKTSALTYRWPVGGIVTSIYGWRGRRFHSGIDIATPLGTVAVAAAAGRVLRAGERWGRYGKVVLLEHADGSRTLYAHIDRAFVATGETVTAGQAIVAIGESGNATGPHLHFEIWLGGSTCNPLPLLQR